MNDSDRIEKLEDLQINNVKLTVQIEISYSSLVNDLLIIT